MANGASAPVASRIVGARSALMESSSEALPLGISGPRISSGTRIASSYTRFLPVWIRCSPWKKPLSAV